MSLLVPVQATDGDVAPFRCQPSTRRVPPPPGSTVEKQKRLSSACSGDETWWRNHPRMLSGPRDAGGVHFQALLVIVFFMIAIARAWQMIGARNTRVATIVGELLLERSALAVVPDAVEDDAGASRDSSMSIAPVAVGDSGCCNDLIDGDVDVAVADGR